MKKFICGVLLFILCTNLAFADNQRRFIRQHPYINNPYYRHSSYFENEVLPKDLSALEKYSMNKIYRHEPPLRRLERLETLAFGSTQAGNIESRYKNVENAILSHPNNSIKRTALGTLANYFAGQATGVTPSLFNYDNNYFNNNYGFNNFNNGYGTNRINQYTNGMFGSGFSILNNSLGNRSTVRILD
ncbi:MAG: hypothetical protein MJ230_05080 [bacterium]|nr:hypothetical protein [bacterium]